MARVLFALSLVSNVVFAFLLFRGQPPDTSPTTLTSAEQPLVTKNDAHGASASNFAATMIASYYRALSAKELNEKERASLMLAYLQERYDQASARQGSYASFCDSPSKVLDQARDEALSSLRESAIDDPVFGCLFRPLWREYPDLSAQKQMEVHRLLESYSREGEQAGSHPDSTKARKDSYKRLLARVGEVLSTDEYDEFMVWASPLAKAIQRMNLELDDSRYRTLVQLVDNDERLSQLVLGNAAGLPRTAFQNAQIAELLGSERYVRFAYSVDPIGAGAPVGELGKRLAQGVPTKAQAVGLYRSRPSPAPQQ